MFAMIESSGFIQTIIIKKVLFQNDQKETYFGLNLHFFTE